MSHNFFLKFTSLFLLLGIVLVLTACTAAPPTPTSAPSANPQPAAVMPLLTMVEYGFRFRYPPEYQAAIFQNQICLALEQGYGPPGLCHVKNFSIEISDVPDRSLTQVADEASAMGIPDQIVLTSLTVSGEEAILLDNVLGVDVMRMVVIVHDDRAYVLTFVGWQENQVETSPLGILYNTIINSFEFLPQPVINNYEELEFGISSVIPITIYSGPTSSSQPAGILEAGTPAKVIGRVDGVWLEIICPEGIPRRCWVLWDMNALYSHEGAPVTLEIPDPHSLKIESRDTTTSPDGRWQALVTRSETVTLGAEDARFFYVELIVTSLENGTTWRPVSEWHVAGLGQEEPLQLFHWSKDGRFLYYTSLIYPDGACAFYNNIGETFERLDLTDGSVDALQSPEALGIVAISPDETMLAYIVAQPFVGGPRYHLMIHDLETAFTRGVDWRGLVKWMIWLDMFPHENVSRIAWSPDNRKVLVTVTELADNCQSVSAAEWELDVATGEFVEVSNTVFPTATP